MNSDYANGIKVGDIISAYHKGYHRVVDIERRFTTSYEANEKIIAGSEYSSLIIYVPLYNSDGTISNRKKPYECDATYCKPALEKIDREIELLENKKDRLLKLKNKFAGIA